MPIALSVSRQINNVSTKIAFIPRAREVRKLPVAAMTSVQYQQAQRLKQKPPSAKTQDTVKQFAFYCGPADTGWMSQPGKAPVTHQFP